MKNIVINSLFFSIFSAIGISANAEIDGDNFEFKGHKFGSQISPSKKIQSPLEAILGTDFGYHMYPRITEYNEVKLESLYFGKKKLEAIKYIYFDNRLIEISVIFQKGLNCSDALEINELIELKYGIKTNETFDKKTNIIGKHFNNENISIDISCDESILSLAPEGSTEDRYTAISFKDLRKLKEIGRYKDQIHDSLFQKKSEEKEKIMREKIDF